MWDLKEQRKEHAVGGGECKHRDVRQESEEVKRPGRPSIAGISLSVSICAFLVSFAALYLSRQDAYNAIRAKREQADYLSYRLGIDLGAYRAAGQAKNVPSPAPTVARNRNRLRNTVQARADKLGLGIEIPNPLPLDTISTDALIYQADMCVRDYHGNRSVDHYMLGLYLGQAIGYLSPWAGTAGVQATGANNPLVGRAVPRETSAELDKLTGQINKQLEALGFQHRVQLHEKSGAALFDRLNELDRDIVGTYDPREQRWRR
jgi:hypothetical protein